MKAKELRLMSDVDLNSKVAELKKELMKSNSQIAAGTVPKNPSRVGEMKKTIAKIYTIKTEKTMAKPIAAKPKQPKTVETKKSESKAANPAKKETKGGSKQE